MSSDWLYYVFGLILMVANATAWMGTFYGLPGNWIIVANSTLFVLFFPDKPNGLGFGWFTVALLAMLAILGESVAHAVERQRDNPESSGRSLRGILTGAGAGSLAGGLMGLLIPVIGPLVSILGSMGGAAGGAYLGTLWSEQTREQKQPVLQSRVVEQLRPQIRTIPLLIAGAMMWLFATFGSFSG